MGVRKILNKKLFLIFWAGGPQEVLKNKPFQLTKNHCNCVHKEEDHKHRILNPLSPNSDQHQISPCDSNAHLTPEVMRIKDVITQGEFSWYFNNFSTVLYKKSMGKR